MSWAVMAECFLHQWRKFTDSEIRFTIGNAANSSMVFITTVVIVNVGDYADVERVIGGHNTGNALHVIVTTQSPTWSSTSSHTNSLTYYYWKFYNIYKTLLYISSSLSPITAVLSEWLELSVHCISYHASHIKSGIFRGLPEPNKPTAPRPLLSLYGIIYVTWYTSDLPEATGVRLRLPNSHALLGSGRPCKTPLSTHHQSICLFAYITISSASFCAQLMMHDVLLYYHSSPSNRQNLFQMSGLHNPTWLTSWYKTTQLLIP